MSGVHEATKNRVNELKDLLNDAFQRRQDSKVFKIIETLNVINMTEVILRETGISLLLRDIKNVDVYKKTAKDTLREWKKAVLKERGEGKDVGVLRGEHSPIPPSCKRMCSPTKKSFIEQKRNMMSFRNSSGTDSCEYDSTAKRTKLDLVDKRRKGVCVYSDGVVPSLENLAISFLTKNIGSLEDIGDIPGKLLIPVLQQCDAEELYRLESCNPHIIPSTKKLWKALCESKFPGACRNKATLEKWRDCYARCVREQELKLEQARKRLKRNYDEKNQMKQKRSVRAIGSVPSPSSSQATSSSKGRNVRKMLAASIVKPITTRVIRAGGGTARSTVNNPSRPGKKSSSIMAKTVKQMRGRR